MVWVQQAVITSVPGSITFISPAVPANSNWLVYAPDIDEFDVQSYGVLLLQIFNFDIGGEFMTAYSHQCFTRVESVFQPLPILGTLNLRTGFYAGLKTSPRSIEIWTET